MAIPSIFNDVIGPIMIGPSSSHVAGAARIGQMTRCLLTSRTEKVSVSFSADGALASTYHSQGSDMGFVCGLMGMELNDPDTAKGLEKIKDYLAVEFDIINEPAPHPNNYTIQVHEGQLAIILRAISTGGGMIEVYDLNGFNVQLRGDYDVIAVFADQDIKTSLENICGQKVHSQEKQGRYLFLIYTKNDLLRNIETLPHVIRAIRFLPVLPILSADSYNLPFTDYGSLVRLINTDNHSYPLSKYAMDYESARGHSDSAGIMHFTDRVLSVMKDAIQAGMKKEYYEDRILQSQAYLMKEKAEQNALLPVPMLNTVIMYITAVMEAKSSMKPIVAAPTAGASGCLPGTLFGCAEHMGADHESIRQALLSAGLIGVFFAGQATFAAEVAGCQVECGAASGMAAAALTELMGGSAEQSLRAASIALQGITGLACDPVASRVESPCLNKNIMAGANAITSANMALSGFDQVIPLDETINAILEIGRSLPQSLRCTYGGLGKTPASQAIQKELESKTKA